MHRIFLCLLALALYSCNDQGPVLGSWYLTHTGTPADDYMAGAISDDNPYYLAAGTTIAGDAGNILLAHISADPGYLPSYYQIERPGLQEARSIIARGDAGLILGYTDPEEDGKTDALALQVNGISEP